ncbi:alanyl-tRNA synthetase [Peptostreptococcaceae bacterium pGA-8]|nr:alanyl-tRNA synthetase [Peptostreptococcaceae bacterium pGA-8]
MEKLGLNEIRSRFRDFYISKGHYGAKSASLIPSGDKSLLLINSGMAPLKPYFAGLETPPSTRMTTCQKCIRTGDIENVGKTSRHGTFFEMLGNFSFGDYFKKESLTWGWEFITKELNMPTDKLWATVYQDDDEAFELWKELGMPEERIVRLGKDDNFWEIGLGPCGPCSEIYYDRGEAYGCDDEDCKPGCECDRYIEFWNHVFTQFSKEEDGSYSKLEHPNIDTGMGLERLACIMQGVDSIFDIDTIRYILEGVIEISGISYEDGEKATDISIRIITDHLRSMVFMIGDGITPSNEGRGYVLRRLIRRAARHGRILGIKGAFLSKLADRVIYISGDAYPELVEKQDYIKKIISVEEEKFAATIDQGFNILNSYIEALKNDDSKILSGEKAFKLYDTYGFPLELTEEILEEDGYGVDKESFAQHMEEQRAKSRGGRKADDEEGWKEATENIDVPETIFTGYEHLAEEATVLEVIQGDKGIFVYLDKTPFYAEGGGQASDNGFISKDGFTGSVDKVTKSHGIIKHFVTVKEGSLIPGDKVLCNVNIYKRNSTARNHTATHLLQKALREVIGSHVEQAGSSVNENMLRFDFTHFESVKEEELFMIENLVNQKIAEFLPVKVAEMSMDEAKAQGATALFGEKYGDTVRVVNSGNWSIELCGGTHVANTGEVGVFKILSESGIASGVRRIEAITGIGVLNRLRNEELIIDQLSENLKSSRDNLVKRAAALSEELKQTKKELDQLKKEAMDSGTDKIIEKAKEINGVKLVREIFEDCQIDYLRRLSDSIKAEYKSVVMVFAAINSGKVTFIVSLTDDLLEKYHAGKLIKEIAAAAGGRGGGKADMAQAGGGNSQLIEKAFEVAETLI